MKNFRYLPDVTTLSLDQHRCTGCGTCGVVCPHGVFQIKEKMAHIVDRNGCMECGACALNCSVDAIGVTPGVGCAAYIIQTWVGGKNGAANSTTKCC